MIINEIMAKYNVNESTESNNIVLLEKSSNYMIGKQQNNICFIVRSRGSRQQRFNNGDMRIALNTRYSIDGISGIYSVIFYSSQSESKIRIFLDTLISCVGDKKLSYDELYSLYNDISSVFKNIAFDHSKYIGLMGELVFIKHMNEIHNINMVDYYQSGDSHLVDFIVKDLIFEVKSTIGGNRSHIINNDQLNGKGYIISVMITESNIGVTFIDLFNEIRDLFSNNIKKFSYVNNFILTIPKDLVNEKYVFENEKIHCIEFDKIPHFKNVHDSISKIKFTCNLSNLEYLSLNNIDTSNFK